MPLANIAPYCSKAERRVPWVGGGWWWCKPIFVSNPQPSYFGLLFGWFAIAWLGFAVMTKVVTYIHRYTLATCRSPCAKNTKCAKLAKRTKHAKSA